MQPFRVPFSEYTTLTFCLTLGIHSGQIGGPELVERGNIHFGGDVRVHRQVVIAVSGCHKPFLSQAEQVVLMHEAQTALGCLGTRMLKNRRRADAIKGVTRKTASHHIDFDRREFGQQLHSTSLIFRGARPAWFSLRLAIFLLDCV